MQGQDSQNGEAIKSMGKEVEGLSQSPLRKLDEYIRVDDSVGFVSFLRIHTENTASDDSRELLKSICSHRAIKCATALLEGETSLPPVDLNLPLQDGCYPLHLAAQSLCSGLTELFLKHGSSTQVHCDDNASKYSGMLPINVALEEICNHEYLTEWTPELSIFKSVYPFYLPELDEPLETVKLLASNTEDILVIACSYVREGRLLELVALLVVVREKLLPPAAIMDKSIDCPSVAHFIMQQLHLSIESQASLWGNPQKSELKQMWKYYNSLMLRAVVLIEIFERAGRQLDSYRKRKAHGDIPRYYMVQEVANLLRECNFLVTDEDTSADGMNCLLAKLDTRKTKKRSKAFLNEMFYAQRSVTRLFNGRKMLAAEVPAADQGGTSRRSFHSCDLSDSRAVVKLDTQRLATQPSRASAHLSETLLQTSRRWIFSTLKRCGRI